MGGGSTPISFQDVVLTGEESEVRDLLANGGCPENFVDEYIMNNYDENYGMPLTEFFGFLFEFFNDIYS